ncbi:alanine racemase [Salinifilum ghardaiensis]
MFTARPARRAHRGAHAPAPQHATRFDAATADAEAPLAVVDLEAFEANAAELVRRAAGTPIRVATKSLRCRELVHRALQVPGFAGAMCYSLAEALWLHRTGTSADILVAYPSVERAALRELATDPDARRAITITADSVEHLDVVDAALGGAAHAPVRVCLELDASWRPLGVPALHVGARRSPVRTPRQLAALARAVLARPGFQLTGVLAYEGQIAGVPDDPGGARGAAVRWVRRRSAADLARRRTDAVAAVRELAQLEFVNGGGTGSLELTGAEAGVTELAAGSGLVGPGLFDSYRAFRPRPALLFGLPVVHRPARGIATLYSGGYVASGPPGPDRVPRPHLPRGLRLTRAEGAGEVQTPVRGRAAGALRLGDRVWLRHAKAGEPAERFDTYHLVRGGERVASVPTYRGEDRNFG